LTEPSGQTARAATLRKEVNHLKRVLAEKTLEVDVFKRALQKVEARSRLSRQLRRESIYDQIREILPLQGGLGVEGMCELATVSRAGFCRRIKEPQPARKQKCGP
jgi:hypothetical protein